MRSVPLSPFVSQKVCKIQIASNCYIQRCGCYKLDFASLGLQVGSWEIRRGVNDMDLLYNTTAINSPTSLAVKPDLFETHCVFHSPASC